MINYWLVLAYTLYGCILFRFRGGMFGDLIKRFLPFWGTTTTRIAFSALLMLPFLTILGWYYVLAVIGLYLGCLMRLYPWQYQQNQPTDIFCLSLRGILYTLTIGAILLHPFLAFSGAAQGMLYYAGTLFPKWHEQWPWQGIPNEMTNSDWGEYMFGAWLGFCLGVTLYVY